MTGQAHNENEPLRAALELLALLLLPVLLGLLWIFVVFNREYRSCVLLENGASLGYKAVFDLNRPFFKPFAVPKLPNGAPIVDDDLWGITVTPTTIYGVEGTLYSFAWRKDVGTVLAHEDRATYERLVAEAGGPLNYGYGGRPELGGHFPNGHYGTKIIMDYLVEERGFERSYCWTELVTRSR